MFEGETLDRLVPIRGRLGLLECGRWGARARAGGRAGRLAGGRRRATRPGLRFGGVESIGNEARRGLRWLRRVR